MIIILLLFTGGCAFLDLKNRRIPNGLILSGFLLLALIRFGFGLKAGYIDGVGELPPGITASLAAGLIQLCGCLLRTLVLLSILFPLYLLRMVGAGDIKLAAVLLGGAGMQLGGMVLLCGMAAAGVWSLYLLVRRGLAAERIRYLVFYLCRLSCGGTMLPYYQKERDGTKAAFCLAPCLFLGVMGAALLLYC